jgi:hypothetical protein
LRGESIAHVHPHRLRSFRDVSFRLPCTGGKVISGAFDDALETNPVPLFMLARELHGARSVGTMLPKDQALEEAKRQGVSVKVPEEGISSAALGILVERRKDDAARSLLFARQEGSLTSVGVFGAQLAASFLDPVNAAAGFIPVLGGTRYAAALGKAATLGERAAFGRYRGGRRAGRCDSGRGSDLAPTA